MTLDPMISISHTMEEEHMRSGLAQKTNDSRPYMVKASVRELKSTLSMSGLLTGDVKATFNQAALDIGIRTIDNLYKVLAQPTYILLITSTK